MAASGFRLKQSAYRHGTAITVLLACLGGPAIAGPVGPPETFQSDAVGSFPKGWNDVALVDPASTAPKPSAKVVSTTDAFGHPTKALAPLPKLGAPRGIYRSINPSSFYSTNAQVRVDQFSDVDYSVLVPDPNNPGFLLCGCPVGSENLVDWAMQVGLTQQQGTTNLAEAPNVGILASAETQSWHLFALTANVLADVDLGVPVELGKWYGVEFDLDAATGSAHGSITDVATGSVLADKAVSFADFGAWDPANDGMLNLESFYDGEGSAKTTPNLAVIDNIDARVPEPTTIVLLASALALGAAVRRRKRPRILRLSVPTLLPKALTCVAPLIAAFAWSTSAGATLFIEPVISHFPGSGPGPTVFPLYDPTYINEATGEQVSIARKPGQIDSWSAGYPREEVMVTFGMWNNTAYNITRLTLNIIGSTVQLSDSAWLVTHDPNVDAFFGDANGDGAVGLSDIFGTITVSNGGRTLTLSDGMIPANSHFTDYIFSYTTDGLPFTAAFEGTFDGVVPEPATWTAAYRAGCDLARNAAPKLIAQSQRMPFDQTIQILGAVKRGFQVLVSIH